MFEFFVQGRRPDTNAPFYIVGEKHGVDVSAFKSLLTVLMERYPDLDVWVECPSYNVLRLLRSQDGSPISTLANFGYT